MLQDLEHCSMFMHELLEYVRNSMLVIDSQKRDNGNEVSLKFEALYIKSVENSDYLLKKHRG